VASKEAIESLKRQISRRLLRLPGVTGVGVQRADDADDYALVVHVKEDDAETRAAVTREAGDHEAVRIVRSGTFRKL
jgi:hypothetical protein